MLLRSEIIHFPHRRRLHCLVDQICYHPHPQDLNEWRHPYNIFKDYKS